MTHIKNQAVTPSPLSTPQTSNIEAFTRNNLKFSGNNTGNNATYEVKPDEVFQGAINIYIRFIAAIKKSLEYYLTLSRNYLPIGNSYFVAIDHDIDVLEGGSGTGISLHRSEVSYYHLRVQWNVSGFLTMWCHTPSTVRLRSISDTIFGGFVDATDAEIWLSPSGKRGIYCGMETSSKSPPSLDVQSSKNEQRVQIVKHVSSSEQWKSSIVAHLINQGFIMSLQDTWIRVRIQLLSNYKREDGLPNDMTTQEVIILWPAKLCFHRPDGHGNEHNDLQTPDESARWISDPLTAAETWMMGKAERAERTEAKRQEDMIFIARLRETEDADEDAMSDAYYRTSQYIDAQDVNGIYPTPPDGFPSQNPEPQSIHDVQISSSTNRDIDGDKFDSVSQRQSDLTSATNLDNQPNSLQFNAEKDDDLFGDMDTEMFASNGLTDADFSFFDNPTFDMTDEVVDQIREKNLPDNTTTNIPLPTPAAFEFATYGTQLTNTANVIQMGSIDASPVETQSFLPRGASLLDSCITMSSPAESVGLDSNYVPTLTNPRWTTLAANSSSSASQTQLDQGKRMSEALTNMNLAKSNSNTRFGSDTKDRNSSVFDMVMFSSGLDSDEKYTDTGRFGFDVDNSQMSIGRKPNPSQVTSSSVLLPRLKPPYTASMASLSGDESISDAGLLDTERFS